MDIHVAEQLGVEQVIPLPEETPVAEQKAVLMCSH
jgi:hypothetical protein